MKDKKVNINTEYEKLTKEEISSHKDFGKLHSSYLSAKVKPMKVAKHYTFTKVLVLASVTTIVTVSVWKYMSTTQHSNTRATTSTQNTHKADIKALATNTTTVKKPFINPPIKGINVPYKSYKVDASKGGVITYNKSKITIPSAAFCDEKGNEVRGSVQIDYREFHDPVDFAVSGIPMTYDSAGVTYNFESAGMLDMQGTQNGKPVFVKPGKNIQVAMSSFQTGKKYNVYLLDTVKRNWTYVTKSKYEVIKVKTTVTTKQNDKKADSISTPKNQDMITIQESVKKLEAEKPMKPVEATDETKTLNIEADSRDFPELSVYKNVTFEVDESNKDYSPDWSNTVWTDAKLSRKGDNEKDYIFTVSNGSVKHEILVHPVFKGKNYEVAMNEYKQKYSEYQAKLVQKQEEAKREQEAYDKRMAELEKKQEEENARQMAQIRKQQEENAKEQVRMDRGKISGGEVQETDVVNYLNVNKFGMWNCDNPMALPKGASLMASYTDDHKDNLSTTNVFLVQKDRNSIVEYYPGHNCSFDPLERNFAWAVTPDHKLAIYSEEDFNAIQQRKGDFTFVLKVLDNDIKTEGDIKEALNPYM